MTRATHIGRPLPRIPSPTPSDGVLLVRPSWRWRLAARRAARRDLEASAPLQSMTPFQQRLRAGFQAARELLLAQHVCVAGRLEERLAEIARRLSWRETEGASARTEIARLEHELDSLPVPRRPLRLRAGSYYALLGVLALFEWPLLRLALTRLPLSDAAIDAVALGLGIASMVVIHATGIAAAGVVRREGERVEDRRDWFVHATALGALVAANAGFVAAFALLRGSELDGLSRLVGRAGLEDPSPEGGTEPLLGIASPGALAVGLAFFHLMVLAAGFLLAYWRARGREWRELECALATADADLGRAEHAAEELESERDRLQKRLAVLEEQACHRLAELCRLHELVEAEYLAVLRRVLPVPLAPIGDWDTDGVVPAAAERRGGWRPPHDGERPRAALEGIGVNDGSP